MQLKHLNTVASIVPIERIFDEYVLCSLRIGYALGHRAKLHWRMVDDQFCLIDIGIEPFTGMLVALTVELYLGEFTHIHEQRTKAELTYGIPTFDLGLWPNSTLHYQFSADFYDVKGRFGIQLAGQDLYISLATDNITYRVGWPSSFSCEFNQSSTLCGIWLHDLTRNELDVLDDYIEEVKMVA